MENFNAMNTVFNTTIKRLTEPVLFDGDKRQLPQFFRASLTFAQGRHAAIDAFFESVKSHLHGYRYISIDSRLHMLMRGMYPCIPGWHCDDFYRTARTNWQPDLDRVKKEAPSNHFCLVWGADISATEFMYSMFYGLASADPLRSDMPLYGQYNDYIESVYKESFLVNEGEIVNFGPTDFHRGSPAVQNGWRYFIRLTESNHYEPLNEIRTQTQVYLPTTNLGW